VKQDILLTEGEQDHLFNVDWMYRTMHELVCAHSSRHAFSPHGKEESSTARLAIQPSPAEKSCAGSLNFILECRRLAPELSGCLLLALLRTAPKSANRSLSE
jgi:hypothetical protein